MAASGSEGTVDGGATGGWVLCELAGAGRPGATIAHVVNRMAVQSPGCDIALAFGALTPAPGWQQKLRDAARRESTTATVSALSVDAGSDAEETEALEDPHLHLTKDFTEAVSAFIEKREPAFLGE